MIKHKYPPMTIERVENRLRLIGGLEYTYEPGSDLAFVHWLCFEYLNLREELEETENFNLLKRMGNNFANALEEIESLQSENKQLKDAINELVAFAESGGNDSDPDNQMEYARLFGIIEGLARND